MRTGQTSVRVSVDNRDELAEVAQRIGGSLDDALKAVLFAYASLAAIASLHADPIGLADSRDEAQQWAELDVSAGG